MPHNGLLFVLVGPSGSGKNTIMDTILHHQHPCNLRQLPTATTRLKRATETHGIQHLFISVNEFQKLIADNALVEYQRVHKTDFYGTPRQEVEKAITSGEIVMADIDIYGAKALKSAFPENVILIFISPPSHDALERRIRERQTDTEAEIKNRLSRAALEMSYALRTDYVIVNDNLTEATALVNAVILAEQQRQPIHLPIQARAVVSKLDGTVLTVRGNLPAVPVYDPQQAPQLVIENLRTQFGVITETVENPYTALWCCQQGDQVMTEMIVPLRVFYSPEHLDWYFPENLPLPFHLKAGLTQAQPTP